ncbi:MAG: hypothetical protein COY09_02455 [Candidatus Portnoybacteria bacterium CG_4_10_14_0_2_um_filter_39_11]|uniref:DUF4878 domain-containing protein n=1 Tax=Candidatus Portnoybacteria bacterium CG_4_10_14_0_2_um_filter_39_11 TaxID=1974797 RepID=A0A2M7UHF6_9BACT|nr:MAG: hypothetical protein AUJ33_03385 [Parcubacteria group bacterium CG1_02_40_25]PIZ70647.1 MAG: hypothetical protein COY09_02455 [Candidatus Portnoybacteria bacterium CG_4_10_14_0_2_um_filter_39_11]
MKSGLKTFLWIFSGVVIFCLALELGWDLRTAWEPQRGLRAWVKFGQEVEKLYRQDKDGGKTPEETMALFLDALRSGDTDQASKYFILDKQDQWREDLVKIKADGYLDEIIDYAESAKKTKEEGSFAWFNIDNTNPNRGSGLIVLEKNNESGVWKISVL